MSLRRKASFQPDVLEWVASQRGPLKYLRRELYKEEKGFVYYFKAAVSYFSGTANAQSTTPTVSEEEQKKTQELANESMDQYYESQDLIKRMKWKRVTWDKDADYAGFSRRIIDNDDMFKHVPAFSFMSLRVVKDPVTNDLVTLPNPEKSIVEGSLTNWVLRERDPAEVAVYPLRDLSASRSAFSVDWTAGEVQMLDTASAQEVLTFLSTGAPRLQALQIRMNEQNVKQTEDVEKVRVRVGAVVKFNEFDSSFWDDPKRKTNPEYVTPADMEMFLGGMLKSPLLYRWFFYGQQIRVVQPGKPYNTDLTKKEIQLPANFAEFNWLGAHARFEGFERMVDSCRRYWWLWFGISMVLVGDVEIL